MKRQFDKTEKEVTERNLKKRKEELKDFNESLKILEATEQFNKVQNDYNDLARPYNRKIQEKEYSDKIKLLNSHIKETEQTVEIAEKQLKEGVTIKKITEVK